MPDPLPGASQPSYCGGIDPATSDYRANAGIGSILTDISGWSLNGCSNNTYLKTTAKLSNITR